MRILPIIHKENPYAGFESQKHTPDVQGWGSKHQIFSMLISAVRPESIIEVGSWKGASAITMGCAAKQCGLEPEIVCVDTWLGSSGLYIRGDDSKLSLRPIHGYPSLYYTFLANVVRAGLTDVITPFPMNSTSAAEVLAHFSYKAGLIYIDASHDYASVIADLKAYWPLLTDDGVLFGDDYAAWAGVTKAVNEFAASVDRPVYGSYGKFVIPRNARTRLRASYAVELSDRSP